ncbi:MAG: hypothetical protein PUK70_07185 [Bacteroidales bacterium]|nr:hypothetical protein [Bacteroidales bacterium]MDY6002171.1 hypothetical protein [Candidatus Cryptobacteroides sp.]
MEPCCFRCSTTRINYTILRLPLNGFIIPTVGTDNQPEISINQSIIHIRNNLEEKEESKWKYGVLSLGKAISVTVRLTSSWDHCPMVQLGENLSQDGIAAFGGNLRAALFLNERAIDNPSRE